MQSTVKQGYNMTTKIPTDSSNYSSDGIQCKYFDNGDGTGWKLYYGKEETIQAWASQIWALTKNGAPFILSGIKEFEFEKKDNFPEQVCMYGFLVENVDIIGDELGIDYTSPRNQRSYFKELFSTKEGLDCHCGNWGIVRDTLVMIDFGTHFFGGLNTKQRAEIERIGEQVIITKLGD